MSTPLYLSQNFSTTLNVGGGIDASQTTGIVLTSVSGLNTSGGYLCLDWAAALDTSVAEYISYTGISGNTLTGVTRGAEGSSGKAHSNGATIVAVVSKNHVNILADKLRGVDVVAIEDANANELLKTSTTASAVNELTIANAATGNAPSLAATGGDTNIDLALLGKGTGAVKLSGLKYPTADGSANQIIQTNGSGVLSFANAGSGKILQIVTATYSTETTNTTGTAADTGLTATITPSSNTSKILVQVSQGDVSTSSTTTFMEIKLLRAGSAIMTPMAFGGGGTADQRTQCAFNYLDSPASTSALIYKTQFRISSGTGTVRVQRDSSTASIILMEIAP